ncbi:MAG: hypothetical protein RLZZ597_3506, partial [Cyanobacteriota bacterium]
MSSQPFEVIPVAGRIGAEIVGLGLSHPLSDDTIQAIRQTLVQYKVIFFRGQHDFNSEN